MERREFLRNALMLGAGGVLLLGPGAWAARAATSGAGQSPRLVVIFLRGAVDGLNVVVPHGESIYYELRPTIAVPASQVLDLDGHFGLPPALAGLMPLWRERSLAFVEACGSPDPTRSHFDAQDYMETGTPGVKTTSTGWMNRVLTELPAPHSPTQALNLGPTPPRILAGPQPVANLATGRAAAQPIALDRPLVNSSFARMYAGRDPLSAAFQEGVAARRRLLAELQQDMTVAAGGAPLPNQGFAQDATRLGRLMRRDPSIRLAFVALAGWDTHVNQGAAGGQLANHLRPLSEGLLSLIGAMGSTYHETVIVVISEFGRTVHENGNGGTDHGHANVMWVMGGPVRGGKVYGTWPGLAPEQLYQGRDLAVTTDFRAPLSSILSTHLKLSDHALGQIFPAYRGRGPQLLAA
ncbi:MAG TPA: DUF1501 domain-containing protein [Candidatus Binataceae bacterium]|nr:DUF1501 domain-containing protein [Candidatus Binataceae bacterium]